MYDSAARWTNLRTSVVLLIYFDADMLQLSHYNKKVIDGHMTSSTVPSLMLMT